MASTGPRSMPSRETFCSNVRSSGPESKRTVCTLSPRRNVSRQDRPCAAQHRQAPPSTHAAPRRRARPPSSVSTNEGTEESESVTLSTRIWTSTESTGVRLVMCHHQANSLPPQTKTIRCVSIAGMLLRPDLERTVGEEILIAAADGGTFAAYLALPTRAPAPGLIMLPEIFNSNSHIRSVTDGYAADGFVALAPDVYWRQ